MDNRAAAEDNKAVAHIVDWVAVRIVDSVDWVAEDTADSVVVDSPAEDTDSSNGVDLNTD